MIPVGTRGKSLEHEHKVDAPRTGKTHHAHVGGVLDAAGARQIGTGIRTPVAHESHDFRFELRGGRRLFIFFFHKVGILTD